MRLTIFDYGAGNLHSLQKAVSEDGIDVKIEADPFRCVDTDLLLLPGVGSFTQASSCLGPARAALHDAIAGGLPTIGICLGMQLLFKRSDEGPGEGIGVAEGLVTRLSAKRTPQMGWNSFEDVRDPLFGKTALTTAYYANSFVCRPADREAVVAWSRHEDDVFPAMVRVGSAIGVQFHPEKSSAAGVRFLRAAIQEIRP